MKLKSLALAAALLPAFGSAFADDFTVDLIGGPNVWSASLGATHTTGNFSDTFTFSNYSADSGTVFASLINTATSWSDLSFTSVTLNGNNIATGDMYAWSLTSRGCLRRSRLTEHRAGEDVGQASCAANGEGTLHEGAAALRAVQGIAQQVVKMGLRIGSKSHCIILQRFEKRMVSTGSTTTLVARKEILASLPK